MEAKDIHIDAQIVQKIDKAKIEAEEEENHKRMNLMKKSFSLIEDDETTNEKTNNESDQIEKYKTVIKNLKKKVKNL